jgi:hypothetical protein
MSDPFERLRRDTGGSAPPPMEAIRTRAARIERRRHYVLGGGGGAIALIALVALFAGTTPNDTERRLAQSGVAVSPTPEFIAGTSSPLTENSAEHRLAEPDTGSTAATGGTTAATVSAPQQESADSRTGTAGAASGEAMSPDIDVSLEVSDQSFGFFRQIEFTLNACNNGADAVERTFPTGQRYDFEVGRDGERVWRWSHGRVFTQEFGTERWEPGECKTYSETWDGQDSNGSSVPSGEYRAFGVLSSDPPLRTGTQEFCVDSC